MSIVSEESKKRIYLDFAARTPVSSTVLNKMSSYWGIEYGNPGSLHTEAVRAKKAIEDARQKTASFLSAESDEIIFTANGTEANNIAIQGVLRRIQKEYDDAIHIVTTHIEHSSVHEVFNALEDDPNIEITYVPTDREGKVSVDEVKDAMRENTVLVSIMFANNEFGTVQPIDEIGRIILKKRKERTSSAPLYFHTDAVQVALYLECDVRKLHVDLLSLDGQKMYGPQGVGALYIRRGTKIEPLMYGGQRENGLRPGTENTPLIVGFAEALTEGASLREEESVRLSRLQDFFIEALQKNLPGIIINGSRENRLPNNVNITIPNVDAEYTVLALDARGIACSTRSACSEGRKGRERRVTEALGLSKDDSRSTLRFSFGRETTEEDLSRVVDVLVEIVGSR